MSGGSVGGGGPGVSKGQQYEFLLFGSLSESNLPTLLHRLRGLCDYATSTTTTTSSSSGGAGGGGGRDGVGLTTFTDREIVLKIGKCKWKA